jgi:hypothetical protein
VALLAYAGAGAVMSLRAFVSQVRACHCAMCDACAGARHECGDAATAAHTARAASRAAVNSARRHTRTGERGTRHHTCGVTSRHTGSLPRCRPSRRSGIQRAAGCARAALARAGDDSICDCDGDTRYRCTVCSHRSTRALRRTRAAISVAGLSKACCCSTLCSLLRSTSPTRTQVSTVCRVLSECAVRVCVRLWLGGVD